MTTALRRRCPACQLVADSDRFPAVRTGARSTLLWPLKCSGCGHTAPARDFRIQAVKR